MSVPVSLQALHDRIREFGGGARAYLVTMGESGPHVVSVEVRTDGELLMVDAGRRTTANVEANPTVTLLWPPVGGGDYSLIVDGTGELLGEDPPALSIHLSAAVLHRVAGATGDGPTCVRVLPAP
jgi:hypothetical protein